MPVIDRLLNGQVICLMKGCMIFTYIWKECLC